MKRENLTRKARYGIMAALIAGAFSIMPAAQAMPTGGTGHRDERGNHGYYEFRGQQPDYLAEFLGGSQ